MIPTTFTFEIRSDRPVDSIETTPSAPGDVRGGSLPAAPCDSDFQAWDEDLPMIIPLDVAGEAVCCEHEGQIFAAVDNFSGLRGVALTDPSGHHLARLALVDGTVALAVPQSDGSKRTFEIVHGDVREVTDQGTPGANGFTTRPVIVQPGEILAAVDTAGRCLAGVAIDHDGQSQSVCLTGPTGKAMATATVSEGRLWFQVGDGTPFQPAECRPVPPPSVN